MNEAVLQYFDRAAWAVLNATNDALPLNARSHLTAVAVHACQSLKEALDQLVEGGSSDTSLAAAIKTLPHTELIENLRNMDLHGCPLPICDPKLRMVAMVSKPDHPIELSSSHGVGVSVQMDGLKPKVHRTSKSLKHGNVKFGGATVSYGCNEGKLIVHDFSTGKDYFVIGILRSFLRHCHLLIKDRMPAANAPAEPPSSSVETEGTQS